MGSRVLKGVMMNKDVIHGKMRRRIEKPRVLLLDCTLEYKKNESATNIEMSNEIIACKPDVVVTEKGVSDLAQHYLVKANISCIRRIRKTDNNRIARVTGASICNRTEELTAEMVGTRCGRFSISRIGEEYFTFMAECEKPQACSVILRGASRDVLNEMERNLQDAFNVARNLVLEPRLLPGGGATEMEMAARLKQNAKGYEGKMQFAYRAVADALEVIPRSLALNCG